MIPVSDAKLLAGLCDGTLMLARAGKTPHDLAKKACQEFRDKGLLGVVLNQVRVNSQVWLLLRSEWTEIQEAAPRE